MTASTVLMVRPAAFGSNPQTLASNAFQHPATRSSELVAAAQHEFDAVRECLVDCGVRVLAFPGRRELDAPDEIFPNNWMTTHADGTLVLYPMMAPNRRRERRQDIVEALGLDLGFEIKRTVDLTSHEAGERYLEGTGSCVLDRERRLAYACLSPRTHEIVLDELAAELGYRTITFRAATEDGMPIYHANVLLSIGSHFVIVCAESIADDSERAMVLESLSENGREIIEITRPQMRALSANILELESGGAHIIAISDAARAALAPDQVSRLGAYGRLVGAPIPTIETYGGGGMRCMLAEIFLPERGRLHLRSSSTAGTRDRTRLVRHHAS